MVKKLTTMFAIIASSVGITGCYTWSWCDHYYLRPEKLEGSRSEKLYHRFDNDHDTVSCLKLYTPYVLTRRYDKYQDIEYPHEGLSTYVIVFYPDSKLANWFVRDTIFKESFDMTRSLQGYYRDQCDDMRIFRYSVLHCGSFSRCKVDSILEDGFILNIGNGLKYTYQETSEFPKEWFEEMEPDW